MKYPKSNTPTRKQEQNNQNQAKIEKKKCEIDITWSTTGDPNKFKSWTQNWPCINTDGGK